MNREFPKMLYKTPGPHDIHGAQIDYCIAQDADDQAAKLADGWFLTTDEAKAPKQATDSPPTRAEMEQKATELGIKFDGRTSDKKLGEMIATALVL